MTTLKTFRSLALGAFVAVAFLLVAAPKPAQAVGLLELQVAELDKESLGARVDHNSAVAMRLYYVGSATEAVVTITTTVITAYAPAGTADSSNFGVSAGSYTLFSAAYDSMGELCDVIDALANYECILEGAKRDDNTKRLRDQTAASGTCDLKAAGGCGIKFSNESDGRANTESYDMRIGINPHIGKRVVLKTCTANISGTDTLKVYGKLAKFEAGSDGSPKGLAGVTAAARDDTTEVHSVATADDTDKTIPASVPTGGAGWLTFAKDAHVVVSAGNTTNVQTSGNGLECQWDER